MIRYEKEIFLYLPVEREGEGQGKGRETEGGRQETIKKERRTR